MGTQKTLGLKKSGVCFPALLFINLFLLASSGAQAKDRINWKRFLAEQDLVFTSLGEKWEEGVFTGNGLLGTMCYLEGDSALRVEIGRTDVYDHREDGDILYSRARLPIGYFKLSAENRIQSASARIDLWNAAATVKVVTEKGKILLRMLTCATDDIILVEETYTGKENGFTWTWVPTQSASPRLNFSYPKHPENYKPNPAPERLKINGSEVCYQPLLAGGGYATSWRSRDLGRKRVHTIAVSYTRENQSLSSGWIKDLQPYDGKIKTLEKEHRSWWHSYYPQSFVSIPDKGLEQFYWIQQYKLASATRSGKPMLDLQGPWTTNTPWPAYWLNLNIQLTYSPLFQANRLNIASSLIENIDRYKDNLSKNVPGHYQYNAAAIGRSAAADLISPVKVTKHSQHQLADGEAEMGNLPWMLYYYWQYYRYTMDKSALQRLFPLLRRSVNYYLHVIEKNGQGQWVFTSRTTSPEYPKGQGYNTNYDLALLKWGCSTLLKIDEILKVTDDLADTWRDVVHNLVPYPVDGNGFRVSTDIPFADSHRHYSHLLMIYPLYEVNWDQPENRKLIEKSLTHWRSLPNALQGYSFTGTASMLAMMGRGNEARDALNILLKKYVKPNTMYLETGPVIETPLSAVTSLQELYLQYWNNKLRIFPAVPEDWTDVSFKNLRTEGAFLVSADRREGKTQWVKIESTCGGKLQIMPNMEGTVYMKTKSEASFRDLGDGLYELNIPEGAVVELLAK